MYFSDEARCQETYLREDTGWALEECNTRIALKCAKFVHDYVCSFAWNREIKIGCLKICFSLSWMRRQLITTVDYIALYMCKLEVLCNKPHSIIWMFGIYMYIKSRCWVNYGVIKFRKQIHVWAQTGVDNLLQRKWIDSNYSTSSGTDWRMRFMFYFQQHIYGVYVGCGFRTCGTWKQLYRSTGIKKNEMKRGAIYCGSCGHKQQSTLLEIEAQNRMGRTYDPYSSYGRSNHGVFDWLTRRRRWTRKD